MSPILYRDTWDQLFAHRMVAGDCWLWTGAVRCHGADGKGDPYGGVHHDDSIWLVHRLAYTLAYGPIPDGLQIDHKCHVTLCFRPDHLRAVTPKVHWDADNDRVVNRAKLDRGRATRWRQARLAKGATP